MVRLHAQHTPMVKGEMPMQDKPVALVTGANQGIGLQSQTHLVAHGLTVLVGSRGHTLGKSNDLRGQVNEATNGNHGRGCRHSVRGAPSSRVCVPGLISRAKPFQIRSSGPPVLIPDERTALFIMTGEHPGFLLHGFRGNGVERSAVLPGSHANSKAHLFSSYETRLKVGA